MQRRQLLAALGGTAGLAGCLDTSDGPDNRPSQWEGGDSVDSGGSDAAAVETAAGSGDATQRVALVKEELDALGIEGPDFETRVENISRVIETVEGERDMWREQAQTIGDDVSGDVTGMLNDLYNAAHEQYQSGQQSVDAVINEYERETYYAAAEEAAQAAGSFSAAWSLAKRARRPTETITAVEGSTGKLSESEAKTAFWTKWAVSYAQHCSIARGLAGPDADKPQGIDSIESDIDAFTWHPPDTVSFSYDPV